LVAGRYRLEELLGGSYTEVWRATDELLGRTVAVKLARPEVAGYHPDRFGNESRMLARLRHPALVTLYDTGIEDGRPYLVMQYVSGLTLAARIRSWPPGAEDTRRIGIAVAGVLDHLHARGVVHRDVKPGNLLLGDDGRVYLADLGIARGADTAVVTATGMVVGTPAYLAPEQVAGGRVGPACDVYALGLVLLECLTGQREYPGPPMEAAVARLNRQPAIPATLPRAWRELLAALTARDPAARPTAREAAERLAALPAVVDHQRPAGVDGWARPAGRAGLTSGSGPERSAGQPRGLGSRRRRRRARATAAVGGVAAGIAGVVVAWSGASPSSPAAPATVVGSVRSAIPSPPSPTGPRSSPVVLATAAAMREATPRPTRAATPRPTRREGGHGKTKPDDARSGAGRGGDGGKGGRHHGD
jgi:hypothetical protein